MGTEQDIFDAALEDDDGPADVNPHREDLKVLGNAIRDGQDPERRVVADAIKAEKEASDAELQAARDAAKRDFDPASAAPQPPEGEEPPPAAESAAPQKEEPPPPQPHQVPLTELLNTRERAQQAERERDELRRALQAFQQQAAQKQQQPPETPDVFADPQAYTGHILQTVEQRLATMQLEQNLSLAEVKHGETFGKAFEAFTGAVGQGQNPALYHQVMRSRDPGGEMVKWYRNEEVLRQVGPDPSAYRQKLADELKSDPAFVASVLEAARAQAGSPQTTNGSRPPNVTRLPSLTRQTSAAPAHQADDGDGSDEALWAAANAPRR